MDRLVLSEAAWDRMAPLIIGRPDQRGSTGRNNRLFVEGVLWIVRTGAPWRDLPEVFGEWNSVFRRFSRWSRKGVWTRIFEAMSDDPDFEYLIVDSTIVRAHQHAAGAQKGGLKIRPSGARAAASAPRSTSSSEVSGARSALRSPPVRRATLHRPMR
jgi:transposase